MIDRWQLAPLMSPSNFRCCPGSCPWTWIGGQRRRGCLAMKSCWQRWPTCPGCRSTGRGSAPSRRGRGGPKWLPGRRSLSTADVSGGSRLITQQKWEIHKHSEEETFLWHLLHEPHKWTNCMHLWSVRKPSIVCRPNFARGGGGKGGALICRVVFSPSQPLNLLLPSRLAIKKKAGREGPGFSALVRTRTVGECLNPH